MSSHLPTKSGASRSGGTAGPAGEAPDGAGQTIAESADDISMKLQIDLPGGARIGPGKIRLLELIEQAGSLSRAAEAMNVSYRRAWLFVQQINQAFDEPAVATPEHGHGGAPARVTEFGRELVRRYREMERQAEAASQDDMRWLARHRKA